MQYEESKKLLRGELIIFAGATYPFIGLYQEGHLLHKTHMLIEDEPNHEDSVLISSVMPYQSFWLFVKAVWNYDRHPHSKDIWVSMDDGETKKEESELIEEFMKIKV